MMVNVYFSIDKREKYFGKKEINQSIKLLVFGELAWKLNISDKTVSKWETAKGYPYISFIASIFKYPNRKINI